MITTNTPDDTVNDAMAWDLEIDRILGLAARALDEQIRGTSPLPTKHAINVAYTCIDLAEAWCNRQIHAIALNNSIASIEDPDEQ